MEKKVPFLIPEPVESTSQDLSLDSTRKDALLKYPLRALQFSDTLSDNRIFVIVLESGEQTKLISGWMPTWDSLA